MGTQNAVNFLKRCRGIKQRQGFRSAAGLRAGTSMVEAVKEFAKLHRLCIGTRHGHYWTALFGSILGDGICCSEAVTMSLTSCAVALELSTGRDTPMQLRRVPQRISTTQGGFCANRDVARWCGAAGSASVCWE